MKRNLTILFCVVGLFAVALAGDVHLGRLSQLTWGGSAADRVASFAAYVIPAFCHWKLNDNAADTVVLDSIDAKNGVGTVNTSAMTESPGKINDCFNFNGSTEGVSVAGLDQWATHAATMSISMWFKTTQNAANHNIAGWSYFRQCNLGTDATAKYLAFSINNAVNPVMRIRSATTNYYNGEWHFAVGVYDSNNMPSMRLYIDNVLEATSNGIYGISTGPDRFSIGCYFAITNGFAAGYAGSTDSVRLWTNALTAAEITNLWNAGTGTED